MAVDVVIVNYNSGGDCARLIRELDQQLDVDLFITVIDSASCDDSLLRARSAADVSSVPVTFKQPGRNVGYTGNNLVLGTSASDVLIVNPDVTLADADIVAGLAAVLAENPELAAVAPIIRTSDGTIEYTDTLIDVERADCHHTGVWIRDWPHPASVHRLQRVDGAIWLLRRAALDDVGLLDDRFFLFYEETDWCIRAGAKGWSLGLSSLQSVLHERSSSFSGTKGTYYAWRNLHLLCSKHAAGSEWESLYRRGLARYAAHPRHMRSGQTRRALRGFLDARRGRFGPAPDDAPSGSEPTVC